MWRKLCNSKEIFSAGKNSGMNLIAVPEERGDFTMENSLVYTTMFILFSYWTLSCISYLHQSSKYSSSTLGWNPYLEAMGMWWLWSRQDYNIWISRAYKDWRTWCQTDFHSEAFLPHLSHFLCNTLSNTFTGNPSQKAKKIKRSKP